MRGYDEATAPARCAAVRADVRLTPSGVSEETAQKRRLSRGAKTCLIVSACLAFLGAAIVVLLVGLGDIGSAGQKKAFLARADAGSRAKKIDIRGKSVYFVVVDSFGRTDPGAPACDTSEPGWCGGTLAGITERLDFIQGMGFDCVWITPVLKQFEGKDGVSGFANYGYWAYDWYKIDENYGTKDDLIDLSAELHKRGMCFIYDMVVNHVGPVYSAADVHKIHPFNETWYFNQPKIGNKTFDEYVAATPLQAIGPGTMCKKSLRRCDNYVCPVKIGFEQLCPVQASYLNASAAGPANIPECGIGDYECEGYDAELTVDGWFYDLGDLNQSVPFVHDELIRWATHMVDTYNIDAIRLDTAPYVPRQFLTDFQEAVKVPVLGEITATNFSFFASYVSSTGPRVLDGALNFPVARTVAPAFCGVFWPGASLNLTRLGAEMNTSITSGMVRDVNLLGNFADNHDGGRLSFYCKGDSSRIANAIVWTMLYQGIPIVYYGTEVKLNETRESMWNLGYDTNTTEYSLISTLNRIRKSQDLGTTDASVKFASQSQLIFTRGGDSHIWVYVNNLAAADAGEVVQYCQVPPAPPTDHEWTDLLTNTPANISGTAWWRQALLLWFSV